MSANCPSTEEGLRDLALARGSIYGFLSSVYGEAPSWKLVESLVQGPLLAALAAVIDDAECYAELADAVRGRDIEAVHEELRVAYTGLLVGPGPNYVAPYQSVYTDRRAIEYCGTPASAPGAVAAKDLLWGDSTVAVLQEYRNAGLELADREVSIPDHLGLELQFMYHLCSQEAEAWGAGNRDLAKKSLELQRGFVERFLLTWTDSFRGQVTALAGHPFYKVMAAVTVGFIKSDLQDISGTLDQIG